MKPILTVIVAGICAGTASPAMAEFRLKTPEVTLEAALGYAWLEANELIYDGDNRISQLIWESEVPIADVTARFDFGSNNYVAAHVRAGLGGNSFMADYDWLALAPSYDFDDWSERSLHPDTRLDHYFDLDIALGRQFELRDNLRFDLHAGLRYTSAQWTAIGGEFTYSLTNLRDYTGTFADTALIEYKTRLPGGFIGAGGAWDFDRWTVSGMVRGGLSVAPETNDFHILRLMTSDHSFDYIPFLSASARVETGFGDHGSLFIAGSYDHYFRQRGDQLAVDYLYGQFGFFPGDAGADFSALALHAGFMLNF